MPQISEIKIAVKTRGMWKLALITFLMRWRSAKHTVHLHLNDGSKIVCLTHAEKVIVDQSPSLTGQR